MLKLTDEGYVYVSKNGIEYDLLEGKTINPHGTTYASDICFIMAFSNKEDDDEHGRFIGWLWGAGFVGRGDDTDDTIGEIVENYENAHPNFVKKYRKEN